MTFELLKNMVISEKKLQQHKNVTFHDYGIIPNVCDHKIQPFFSIQGSKMFAIVPSKKSYEAETY